MFPDSPPVLKLDSFPDEINLFFSFFLSSSSSELVELSRLLLSFSLESLLVELLELPSDVIDFFLTDLSSSELELELSHNGLIRFRFLLGLPPDTGASGINTFISFSSRIRGGSSDMKQT